MNYIFDFISPEILKEKSFGNSSKILIGPFNKNISDSLGFIIRKMLFSTSEGFAIEKVKFKDVKSEFSYKSGIKEEFYDIILNLKKIVIKLIGTNNINILVEKKGPCVFYARDLSRKNCKIYNPDKKILSLNRNINFSFELQIGKGVGYKVLKEDYDSNKNIIIDSYYCPIKKVSYKVLKEKFFDKIEIKIKTNGSLSPLKALIKVFNFINKQFSLFNKSYFCRYKSNEIYFKNIDTFFFDEIIISKLKKNNIYFIGDFLKEKSLESFSNEDIFYIRNKLITLGISLDET